MNGAYPPGPAAKKRPNHLLHGILTVVTCGLWGSVWIVLTARYWNVRDYRYRAEHAGMNRRTGIAVAIVALVAVLGGIGGALVGGSLRSALTGDAPSPAAARFAGPAAGATPSRAATKRVAPARLSGRLGEVVRDGTFAFKVAKVGPGVQRIGGQYAGRDAQGKFVFVTMTIKNTGKRPQALVGEAQYLYDAKGRRYSSDTLSAAYLKGSTTFAEAIQPGGVVKGVIVFDVPRSMRPTKIDLHASALSNGVGISL